MPPPAAPDGAAAAPAAPAADAATAPDAAGSQYIIAFGALASAAVRSAAGAAVGAGAVPFMATGLRRSWSFRVDDEGNKWSAPCVYRSDIEADTCAGVVFATDAADVVRLDGVERGSVRVKLDPACVEPWAGEDDERARSGLAAAKETKAALSESGATLWAYLAAPPADAQIPTLWYPVLQSFLDVVMGGFAEYGGEGFAAEFLDTTLGWGLEKGSWSDDRETPKYALANEAASASGAKWDEIQSQRRPIAYCCRGDKRVLAGSSVVEWEDVDEAYSSSSSDDDDDDEQAEAADGEAADGEATEMATKENPDAGTDLELLEASPTVPPRGAKVRVQTGKGWKDQYFVVEAGVFTIYPDESQAEKLAEIPTEICDLSLPKVSREATPTAT